MSPARVFRHWNPGKLIFGPRSLGELEKEIAADQVPLIVTDRGVASAGILGEVLRVLEQAGVRCQVFDKIVSDPPIEVIEDAAGVYREHGCTMLIGVGGGSSMDAAKAVAIRVTQKGSLREYAQGRPLDSEVAQVCAIPTTAGTGSEVTGTAVITDRENMVKMAIKGYQIVPKTVVLDPTLLRSIPPRVAAETGIDALTHAIEAYVSLNVNPVAATLAISAIRLIGANLRRMVANPSNTDVAANMLLGSCMAGLAFSNAGLGLVHSLAHPAGAHYHTSHGLSCALYLPVVMRYNMPACEGEFAAIADALGEDVRGLSLRAAAQRAVASVEELIADLGIPRTFSEAGITFELRAKMVDDAFAAAPTKSNPRIADKEQIARLFMAAA